MSEEGDRDDPRRAVIEALLQDDQELPTSKLGRMARGAWTAFRSRDLWSEVLEGGDRDLTIADVQNAVSSMGQMKGVAMKTGQMLSYLDLDLPDEVQAALGALRTHAQPMPADEVRERLTSQLGDHGHAVAQRLEPEPVAAASIGQVHRSRLPDGTEIAVKVQYDGIEETIRGDFETGSIGPELVSRLYPESAARAFHEHARQTVLAECDYDREARMQARFRSLFADHDVIEVPEVFDEYCSRRVLSTRFVDAPGFEDWLDGDPDQATRDRVGRALFTFYLRPLFARGLFNADPHPGNYLFPAEDRVAVLDHGCVCRFEDRFVDALAQMSQAARHGQPDELQQALWEAGIVDEEREQDAERMVELIQGFYGPMADDRRRRIDLDEGIGFRELYERRFELARLNVPSEFLFLTRIRFGLMSVLSDLEAEANWFALEDACLEARR